MYCTVGWSELALFAIFEKLHVSADQVYFYEVNSKKNCKFRRARVRRMRGKVFIFKKSQGP